MDDKRDLLQRLSLDRSETGSARAPRLALWITGLGIVVLIGAGTVMLSLREGGENAPQDGGSGESAVEDSGAAGSAALSGPAGTADVAAANGQSGATPPAADERVLNASGYIVARRRATVSAEITGRITEILVEEGMQIEAGQIVARLDDALARADLRLAQAQVAGARADVARAEAELAEARRVLGRTETLNLENYSSEAAFTRAQADVDMAAATLARAQADLELALAQADRARERVDDHVIRAPFTGVVTDKNAQPGEIISPASAGGSFTRTGICTLVDMDSLEIEVDVNEAYIGRVREGQRVEARLDAYPDWTIPARVVAIIPTADRAQATVQVRIGLEETESRILPEMGVNVVFLNDG